MSRSNTVIGAKIGAAYVFRRSKIRLRLLERHKREGLQNSVKLKKCGVTNSRGTKSQASKTKCFTTKG